jgi:hypothetical protein
MDSLLELAKIFKNKRIEYDTIYEKTVLEHRNEEKAKSLDAKIKAYNSKPMTLEELCDFGKDIATEYQFIVDNNKLSSLDEKFKYCSSSSFSYTQDYLKSFGEAIRFNKEVDYEYVDYKPKRDKSISPAQRCQNFYNEAIKKLIHYNINILGITKDLASFSDSTETGVMGGTTFFIFYCQKNNYTFECTLEDDCDCGPMLHVRELKNVNTNEKIDISCDIGCVNNESHILQKFLMLINNGDLNDFLDKKYGHIFRLPELLRSAKFVVSDPKNIINETTFDLVSPHDWRFEDSKIGVQTHKGNCVLIPEKQWNRGNLVVNIFPEKRPDKCEVHEALFGHRSERDYCVTVDYNSDDDFENLLQSIECFFNYRTGQYGYYDAQTQSFKNDNDVKEYWASYNTQNNECPLSFSSINKNNGFDLLITYKSIPSSGSLMVGRLENVPYPYDIYVMNFKYDKIKDPLNCYFTIEGKWHDLVQFVSQYDKDHTTDYNLQNICDKLEFKGTFDECFRNINYFLENLVVCL